jgi:hypothetical protein
VSKDKEELKAKVIELFQNSAQDNPAATTVTGNGNIVGNGNFVVRTEKIIHKTIVRPEPGLEHITEDQAASLQRLVKEVVDLEEKVKRQPKGYPAVWRSLNARMKVASYRMIPFSKYPSAEKYLRNWLGRLNSSKSAPKKNGNWRNQRYRHNHAVAKKYDLYDKMRAYMLDKFDAQSQRDLDNTELDQLYRRMAAWKRNIEKQ